MSATGETTAGGAATVAEPADPVIIHTSKVPRTELTYFEEEKTALLLALDWARANCPTGRILIFSGNQSLLKAIQSGALDTQSIRERLDNREGPPPSSGFQVTRAYQAKRPLTNWVKAAPNATDTPPRPISLVTAKALTRRTVTEPSVQQAPSSHVVQTFLQESRLHRHLQRDRWRSPSPPSSRTHTAAQSVRPPSRPSSRPYVPAVQGGAANTRILAAEMPKRRCPPATHLWESSAPTRSSHDRP